MVKAKRCSKRSNIRKRVSDRRKNVGVQDGRASLNQRSTIGTLPDDVLLEIFKSYLDEFLHFQHSWSTLAHVCQRWRNVMFASPRYLDLQITICKTNRLARDLMSGWPALPIAILHTGSPEHGNPEHAFKSGVEGVDNIIAALEHNTRVIDVKLSYVPSWQLERFVAAMQKPFPELTSLDIGVPVADKVEFFGRRTPPVPVFPDSFLGGSAPRLQSLRLDGIPFPGLPKLLLSSHDLVDFHLCDLPRSVYFTPEEMATYLSPMKHLESLNIRFKVTHCPSLAAGQHPPSLTCIVLPALTSLQFYGNSGYLEGLVSRLDVPSLEKMEIKFLNEPVGNISELPRFISRIETFETFDQTDIRIHLTNIQFVFSLRTSSVSSAELSLTFLPMGIRGNITHLSQLTPVVCSFLPSLSRFKCLMLREHRSPSPYLAWLQVENMVNIPLQEILYPFTAVTEIFISKNTVESVSRCMEGLSEERTTGMLPALQNIFVAELQSQEERTQGAIQEFIAAKELAGHPVTLHLWEVDY